MLPKLETILEYKHPDVIKRYHQDYPQNKLSGEQALKLLIQYLWLSRKHELDKIQYPNRKDLQFECTMQPEMLEADDMWHTFLLFTEDYANFCHQYFGGFMHHVPNVVEEISSEKNFETNCADYLSYIYDQLGEETLKMWFAPCLV